MTTLVATAPRLAPSPVTHPEPAEPPTVDCPACGMPATVEWQDMLAGTSGPVVHVKVQCSLNQHWFLMPEELL